MGIVVIGTTFVDVKGYPLGKYIPAGRNAGYVAEVHGGVGRNIAEDIANVGLSPVFVSVVDESGTSTGVLERLNAHGCDTTYVRRTAGGLGMWLAVFDETGDVVASISRRPELDGILRTLEEDGDAIVSGSDGVCIEFDADLPVLERTLELAEKHGKPVFAVISNMTIAAERREYLRQVACLVCNQQEAGILFGRELEFAAPDEVRAALAEELPGLGLSTMVVTMGEQGSVFACADGSDGWCPTSPVDVVDTTGAGDAFFAGVAVGITCGKSVETACAIGTKLATAVIGTDENVCPRMDLAEFGITGA